MVTDAELRALKWRTGRKVGRTVYAQLGHEPSDGDILIGMMGTPLLAAAVAATHNYWLVVQGDRDC